MGKMSEAGFKVQPVSQPLINSCCGAGRFSTLSRPRVGWTELHRICGGRRHVIGARHVVLSFRYIAPLPGTLVKQRGRNMRLRAKFLTFYPPPVRIRGGVGEMPESFFRARPRTQPDILFKWRRSAGWEFKSLDGKSSLVKHET